MFFSSGVQAKELYPEGARGQEVQPGFCLLQHCDLSLSAQIGLPESKFLFYISVEASSQNSEKWVFGFCWELRTDL